ncbi:MAG: cation:proton antiporter [Chlamydiales bacterium]|nr:cation:proton antiporter [Chlamydiales bacterium]
MEAHTFLIQLVVILFSARALGELAAYFKAPSVIGELLTGILIGPSVLGLVELSTPIHLLAQIGIILLLFEVGIETDVGRLAASGVNALLVATVGIVLPFILGFLLSYYFFNLTLLVSLFIGCTLTATSIGITLRVLRDLHQQNSLAAQIITGAAVLDDIVGIIFLTILYEFSTVGTVDLLRAGKILLFIVIFFIIAPIAAKCVSQVIKKWDKKSEIPGLLPSTIISLILFFAWVAYQLGAPELLGGFAAGLALSKRFVLPFGKRLSPDFEFSHKIEVQMKPIVHLFAPIFFVAVGLSINLKEINWESTFIWTLTGALFIAAVIGKALSGFAVLNEKIRTKLIIGTAMIPRGEVGLVFANIGLTVGVFKDDVYTAIILVIVLTTLLAPFVLRELCKSGYMDHEKSKAA